MIALLTAAAWAVHNRVIDDRLLQRADRRHGDGAVGRLIQWQALIDALDNAKEEEKLQRVNGFFNAIPNRLDMDHWGESNYWATPYELLATNGGDCEDFAIAKYFTLKVMGVPESRLRITYVRAYSQSSDGLRIVPHMVLAYYPDETAEPLVLDNLRPEILPASRRTDLRPTYSFNALGLWSAKERGRGRRLGGTERINRWRDLLERMQEAF